MRQQIADGDLASGWHGRTAFGNTLTLECRDVFRNRIGEKEFAFFFEHHHRNGGDGLGHRGDAENRVDLHGPAALDVLESTGVHVHDFSVACHERYDTTDFMAIDVVLHPLVQAVDTLGGDADTIGGCDWQWAG